MRTTARFTLKAVLAITVALLIVIPPLVFLTVALSSGLSLGQAFAALVSQYRSDRLNLAVCTGLSVLPIVLLFLLLGVRRLLKRTGDKSGMYAIGGAIPLVLVALFVNVEYWPTFLPDQTYAGFPHGLEFIIGPGVFAPIGMLIGFAVVWSLTRGTN